MTKTVNHVSHIKSKQKVNGKPQLPSPSLLIEGEIAVNYAKDVETLSLKNESGTVVTFSSDNYYTEQKLGSGFTGANSGNTVTQVIKDNEEVVSSALNDLNSRKLDASEMSNYYTKSETSGKTEISSALGTKVNSTTFTAHTASTVHMDSTEKTNLDSLASNIAAISGITSSKVSNWDTAYNNNHTHNNKSTLDSITASAQAINSLTGTVGTMAFQNTGSYSSATQVNTALSGKANTSDLNVYADSVKFNNTSKYVEFYHGGTSGTKVFEYDASPFLIDGMVNNVEIKNVTSGSSTVTCLVISFNTDAGKQDINIPISNIFDANNYYTKNDLTGSSTSVVVSKAASATTAATAAVANSVDWSNVANPPSTYEPSAHNQASNTITAMTNYSKASTASAIVTSDSLNTAIGKLEKSFDGYVPTGRSVSAASGLTGGGNLSSNITIGLAATGTSGTYGPTANVTGDNGATIKVPQITTDSYGRVTSITERTYTSVDHTYTVNNGTFTISGNGTSVASTSANASANTGLNIKAGTNVTITTATSEITISATDTTYTAATVAPGNITTSSAVGSSTNYARQDHTHGISVTTGDSNGQVKIAGQNATVKGINTMAYEATSSYSSATQVNTALSGKSNTGHTHDERYYTETEIDTKLGSGFTGANSGNTVTKVIEDNELTVAAALNDINARFDGVILKRISQADYDALINAGTVDQNTLYIIVN